MTSHVEENCVRHRRIVPFLRQVVGVHAVSLENAVWSIVAGRPVETGQTYRAVPSTETDICCVVLSMLTTIAASAVVANEVATDAASSEAARKDLDCIEPPTGKSPGTVLSASSGLTSSASKTERIQCEHGDKDSRRRQADYLCCLALDPAEISERFGFHDLSPPAVNCQSLARRTVGATVRW